MRVLAGIRQSKRKELSESPESQRRSIHEWAAQRGHILVGEACDIGVSASISPFRRPDLGPWLTDPERLAQWDIIAFWKVDRAVRDLKHWYGELVPTLYTKLGKHLVATSEGIDTSTSSEIEMAMRVAMAHEELTKLKDRARASWSGLTNRARWAGGIAWFGYEPVQTPQGVKLAIDLDALDVLNTVIDMLRRDFSLNYIAGYLNEEGVLTAWDRHDVRMGREPRGRLWRRHSLYSLLRSRTLLGQMRVNPNRHDGDKEPEYKVLRDAAGAPLQFGDPLLTRREWDEVQRLLDRPKKQYRRAKSSPLLRVAHCNECGRVLYQHPPTQRDRTRRYFCSGKSIPGMRMCEAASFPAEELERVVEALYLSRYGSEEIVTVEAVATVDYDSKISEIDERIVNLAAGLASIQPGPAHDAVTAELNKAQAEREELATAAKARQGVRYTRTGRTYGQEWAEADESGRLDLLRKHNVYVMVQRARGDLPHYIGIGMGYRDWSYSAITW